MPLFCLPDTSNPVRATSKVEQNLQKLEKCSTANSKSGPHSSESRTKSPKIGKMFYRRLQIRSARPRKQTKNGGNASFLSTGLSKSGPRGLESITKSSKIEKIFYSVPSSKRPSCNQCSQSDSKTDKTRQKTMPKLSLRPQSRNDSADKPRSVVGICPHPGCKHITIESSSRLLWHAHYLMFSH